MPEQPAASEQVGEWGVSVEHVLRLAPHVPVTAANHDAPAPEADPDYGTTINSRDITRQDVSNWITDVSAVVSTRLSRRHRLSQRQQEQLKDAAAAVVAVGAAAYLVDGGHPIRAAKNDSASYGDVLWTRYNQMLDKLEEDLASWVPEPEPGQDVNLGISFRFPPTAFPDDLNQRW